MANKIVRLKNGNDSLFPQVKLEGVIGFNTYHDSTKQDSLVAGENLKIINGANIVGSGSVTISPIWGDMWDTKPMTYLEASSAGFWSPVIDASGQSASGIIGYNGSASSVAFPTTINGITMSTTGGSMYTTSASNATIISGDSILNIAERFIGTAGGSAPLLQCISFPRCETVQWSAITQCSTLTSVYLPNCKEVGYGAFYSCTALPSITLSKCTIVRDSAFQYCSALSYVDLPLCSRIGEEMGKCFYGCSSLAIVKLDQCERIGQACFSGCVNLSTISLPKCKWLAGSAFIRCTSLSSIYLMNSSMCSLGWPVSQIFSQTMITSSTGSIIVPSSLVNTYKEDYQWSYFSARIFGV